MPDDLTRAGGRAVILEVALNGATLPATNPTVPRDPAAIAEQALACVAAGASILHSHPEASMTDYEADLPAYRAAWAPILAAHPQALLYPTARLGPPGTAHQNLWAHNLALHREGLAAMSLVDPGSVNLGMRPDGALSPMLGDRPYANSHAATEYRLIESGRVGLAPSISIFDPSFLRAVIGFRARGLIPPGSMLKLYFGADETFGLRPTPTALAAYLELMEGLELPWSAAVLGGDILEGDFLEAVLAAGGHVRTGLEDFSTPSTRSNLELVRATARRIRAAGHRPASFAETRALLGMPDAHQS